MSGPKSRFTIAQIMIVIAAIALILAAALQGGWSSVVISFVLLCGLALVGGIILIRRVVELLSGIPCPACGVRGLERRSILSFSERFFRCPSCGLRCRRGWLGVAGLFPWKDASGTEFDGHYAKSTTEDPWNAPPGLEDEDAIDSKTHLNLVQSKRRRTPENPNGPGLE